MIQSLRKIKNYEWQIIGLIAVGTFILGIKGFLPNRSFIDSIYLSLQLFVFQSGDTGGYVNMYLQISRFLAPFVVAYATIKSVYQLFQKDFGLLFIRDHIVICGLSSESLKLLRDLLAKKMKVVLIENSSEKHSLLNLRTEGVILINEYPSDITALKKAKVKKAKAIFAMNEKDELNVGIVVNIYKMFGMKKTDKRVLCYVHIYEPIFESIFKSHKIFKEPNDMLDARVVNIYRRGSEILINEVPIVDEDFLKNDSQLHIMIMGLGRTGKSILIQTALFHHYSKDQKLKVTIIDRNAANEITQFRNEYPSISTLLEINYNEIEIGSLNEDNFFGSLGNENYKAIYCCAGDDIMRISVIKKLSSNLLSTKLFVCFQRNSDLTQLMEEGEIFKEGKGIQIFNLIDKTCTYDQLINEEVEKLAKVIHENYCKAEKSKGVTEDQNSSIRKWDEITEEMKESNRNQAFHIKLKIEAFGYSLAPLESKKEGVDLSKDLVLLEKMAKAEHIRWVDEKLINGWEYAPRPKNPTRKTHPDIIPYEELDEPGKEKDRDTIRLLPYLLELTGRKIVKK